MIGKDYFVRQATTLLRMARTTRDPQTQAALAAKAADLKSKGDDTPSTEDPSPVPPDVIRRGDH